MTLTKTRGLDIDSQLKWNSPTTSIIYANLPNTYFSILNISRLDQVYILRKLKCVTLMTNSYTFTTTIC